MTAILAPVLITLAIALAIGIVLSVLAKILKPKEPEAAPAEEGSGKVAVITAPKTEKETADFIYEGPASCKAAVRFFRGKRGSVCPGLGDCARVCPNNAISLAGGSAYADPKLCSGCGKCVRECPADFIKLMDKKEVI